MVEVTAKILDEKLEELQEDGIPIVLFLKVHLLSDF
jgi:hypothetical protein